MCFDRQETSAVLDLKTCISDLTKRIGQLEQGKHELSGQNELLKARAIRLDEEKTRAEARGDSLAAELARQQKAAEEARAEAAVSLAEKEAAEGRAERSELEKEEALEAAEQAYMDREEAQAQAVDALAEKEAAEGRAERAEQERLQAVEAAEQADMDREEAQAQAVDALVEKDAAEGRAERSEEERLQAVEAAERAARDREAAKAEKEKAEELEKEASRKSSGVQKAASGALGHIMEATGHCRGLKLGQKAYLLDLGLHEAAWLLFENQAMEPGKKITETDIPWPTDSVLNGTAWGQDTKRKAQLMKRWHPDKFLAKFGPHLEQQQKEEGDNAEGGSSSEGDEEMVERIKDRLNRIQETLKKSKDGFSFA